MAPLLFQDTMGTHGTPIHTQSKRQMHRRLSALKRAFGPNPTLGPSQSPIGQKHGGRGWGSTSKPRRPPALLETLHVAQLSLYASKMQVQRFPHHLQQ